MQTLIVENAGNTCYISSLLMGLFYKPSSNNLLSNDIKDGNLIYLQEYIRINFIEKVRSNKSVSFSIMDEIRLLCLINGWKNDKEIYDQQDVNEFYIFLIEKFNGPLIETQRKTITEALPHKNDTGPIEKIPFIPLSTSGKNIRIKKMLNLWICDNVTKVKRFILTNNGKEEKYVSSLNTYEIKNSPNIMALSINRFKDSMERDNTDVIINVKICPYLDNTFNTQVWNFHSAICHKGDTPKCGHYYTLLNNNNKWYIFDDNKIPSLYEVSMKDEILTSQIKKDCIFLIYTM